MNSAAGRKRERRGGRRALVKVRACGGFVCTRGEERLRLEWIRAEGIVVFD